MDTPSSSRGHNCRGGRSVRENCALAQRQRWALFIHYTTFIVRNSRLFNKTIHEVQDILCSLITSIFVASKKYYVIV